MQPSIFSQNENSEMTSSASCTDTCCAQESPSERPKPLTEFKPFKRLPLELRLMIWTSASPEPSLIARSPDLPNNWKRINGIPAILHACRESRYEFLDTGYEALDAEKEAGFDIDKEPEARRGNHPIYQLSILNHIEGEGMGKMVFVSRDHDLLYDQSRVANDFLFTMLPGRPSFLREVKNVVIQEQQIRTRLGNGFTKDFVLKAATTYPSLRHLTILEVPKPKMWSRCGTNRQSRDIKVLQVCGPKHMQKFWEREKFENPANAPGMEFPSKKFFSVEFRDEEKFRAEHGMVSVQAEKLRQMAAEAKALKAGSVKRAREWEASQRNNGISAFKLRK